MTDEKIRELFGPLPHFVDHVIERYQPLNETAHQFVTSHYWSDQASVNLGDVCGTIHPDYAGMTWRELLTNGQGMDENLAAFRRNPAYYTDAAIIRKPSMYFVRRDGKTWVGEDGNHRTCIGKMYFYNTQHAYIHQVTLSESVVDWTYYDLYRRLCARQGNWRCSVQHENTRREDGPGWKRDFYETHIKVRDGKQEWCWNKEQVAEALDAKAKTGLFGKLFGERK